MNNAPFSFPYCLKICRECLHDVTCFNFNLFLLMKRLLDRKDFKNFVFAQTVSFLVFFEEVGSRKKDGLDYLITLLPSDIILPQKVAAFVNLRDGCGPPMVVSCV